MERSPVVKEYLKKELSMLPEENKKDKDISGGEIRIDYENIDVADIMAQIKSRIAARPKRTREEDRDWEELQPPLSPFPEGAQESKGFRGKIKKVLIKIMRPFSPVIKLLVFPVHQELRETIQNLHNTNLRLDHLDRHLQMFEQAMDQKITLLENTLSQRMDQAFEELRRTQDYTKILHSLSHNLVVEMTKLKIEEEHLKVKTRIMEKDFEFLGKKEKVLEREIIK